MPMHADELPVTLGTVQALVADQFPHWAQRPVRRIESEGTVNAIFRIGDDLAARFPLRPGATRRRLLDEAAAARKLLGRTRFPVPEPVALGEPGPGYPLPWSVQTWLPGVTATYSDPGGSVDFAHDLAEFVAVVRTIDTGGLTFTGSGRGGDLRAHDEWMQTCFQESVNLLDVPRFRRLWVDLRDLPRTDPDTMNHGDLIPANVLVSSAGRLAGVLDVGGLSPADPALDLVAGWHLLDAAPRQAFRVDLACDDLQWARGRAWALEQAMGAAWYYATSHPGFSRLAQRTLTRLVTDP